MKGEDLMSYFFVNVNTVDGNTVGFKIKSDSYSVVAARVMKSDDGWFGVKGKVVNINNITSATIQEINLSDYNINEKDFLLIG